MKRVPDARPEIVSRVIRKAGSATALGRHLGISSQSVSTWRNIPIKHAAKISGLTQIAMNELRPDVWTGATAAAAPTTQPVTSDLAPPAPSVSAADGART